MNAAKRSWAGHPSSRSRLLEAAIATVSSLGYEAVGIEMIVESARVSRREFDRSFADKEDCCRCAFEEVCDHFDRYMLPVYARPLPAQAKVRAAAYACADYCREYAWRVRYGLQVRSRFGASDRAEQSLRFHLEQVDSLRDVDAARRVPAFAADLCVGSLLELVVRLDTAGRLDQLNRSIPLLLFNTYGIYLGTGSAERLLRDEELPGPHWVELDQAPSNHFEH